jgi:hypothetical protein
MALYISCFFCYIFHSTNLYSNPVPNNGYLSTIQTLGLIVTEKIPYQSISYEIMTHMRQNI